MTKIRSSQTIRPAGRHLLTIGEDLIKDRTAAIVELVKNAYDADSPDVLVDISVAEDSRLTLFVEDHGFGMSKEDVINKWLVPSTTSKVGRVKSPKGRTLQGKKGIGRYAAGILGDTLLLETVDCDSNKTSLILNWDSFRNAEYLDEVSIDVITEKVSGKSGTRIMIEGGAEEGAYWSQARIDSLITELRMLVPPTMAGVESDKFEIRVHYENRDHGGEVGYDRDITPFPILKAYDYRIRGVVFSDGERRLWFHNQKAGMSEELLLASGEKGECTVPTGCGDVRFDIRVFDREAESLNAIINRGFGMEEGLELSRQDVRSMLDRLNGIGVYRGGFRIRPLGDPANDWLKLNARRVQNPSMRIGVNQVVGYVHIEDEARSGLEEKSARDGLKDNEAFDCFVSLVLDVLQLLEERRFRFRRSQTEKSGSVGDNLKSLQDYSELKALVSEEMQRQGISDRSISRISGLIEREEKKKKKYAKRVKQAVDAYRGQATLGKIIEIILHEGRRPLNYFKNQVPNLRHHLSKLLSNRDPEESRKKVESIAVGISENTEVLAKLFSRIEPLTTRKRPAAYDVKLAKVIRNAFSVYEGQLKSEGIACDVSIGDDVTIRGWDDDVYAIFVNLIDNSIYWIGKSNSSDRYIRVGLSSSNPNKVIYQDSGVGISPGVIKESVIFEPGYSGRGGTGLGLAIAGDAAKRSGLSLDAVESVSGACFQIGLPKRR